MCLENVDRGAPRNNVTYIQMFNMCLGCPKSGVVEQMDTRSKHIFSMTHFRKKKDIKRYISIYFGSCRDRVFV